MFVLKLSGMHILWCKQLRDLRAPFLKVTHITHSKSYTKIAFLIINIDGPDINYGFWKDIDICLIKIILNSK